MDIDANPGNFEWPAVPGNDGPENFDAFGNAEAEVQVLGGEEAAPPLPLLQEFQYPEVTVTVKTVQEALLWLLSMYRPVSWVTMTQARNQLTNVCFALNPCTMQYVVGPYLLPLGWQSVRTGKTVVRPAEHFYFEITGKNEHDGKLDIQMKRGCGPRRFESIADIDWMAFDLDDNSDLTGQEIYKIRDLLQSNYFASVWASLIEYSYDQCEDLLKSVLPLYGLSGTKPETLRRLLLNAVDKNCRCGSTHLQVSRQGQEENQRFVYLLGERPVCTARIMANNYPRTCRIPAIKAGVFTKAGKLTCFCVRTIVRSSANIRTVFVGDSLTLRNLGHNGACSMDICIMSSVPSHSAALAHTPNIRLVSLELHPLGYRARGGGPHLCGRNKWLRSLYGTDWACEKSRLFGRTGP